jgi:hypothetical protein
MSQHLAARTVKRSDEGDSCAVKPGLGSHATHSPALVHCHYSQAATGGPAAKAPKTSAGFCGGDATPRRQSSWPAPYCEALQLRRCASRKIGGEGERVLERCRLAVRVLKSAASTCDAWRACRAIPIRGGANVIETHLAKRPSTLPCFASTFCIVRLYPCYCRPCNTSPRS